MNLGSVGNGSQKGGHRTVETIGSIRNKVNKNWCRGHMVKEDSVVKKISVENHEDI